MIDHVDDRVVGGVPGHARLADMQAERWGVTFSTWPTRGVLNGAPVDLRALERAAAVVRPGVGEGVRDWRELAASRCEAGAPAVVWDVRGLYFGSADPHGVGDIDAVRVPRRRATFSLLAYDTARLEDLLRRPMPRLNVPATTAPLPPQRPYAGLLAAFPPKVTRLDQVVPVGTIKLIGRWLRRFRRMAAAARRGNASLARRLRPEDLWLPEGQHTVPEARGWVWDLRPLAQGLPARVIDTRTWVEHDLNMQAISILGIDYPDQAIIDECLRGFSDDSQVDFGTLLCAPHSGALAFFEASNRRRRRSPRACSRGGRRITSLMPELEPFHDERWAVLHVCGQFVDDCGGASIDDPLFDSLGRPILDSKGVQVTRALVHLDIVEDVFDAFGHLSSPEKRVFGAQIDLLGVDLDLDSPAAVATMAHELGLEFFDFHVVDWRDVL